MDPDEISRLCAELSIHGGEEKDTFRAVIPRIWQTTVDIEVVQDNTFLFYFRNSGDRFRIMNAPLICMTKEMGEFIGGCLGDLVDIDVGVTGECFGKYMRLRVTIDVSKPLKRFLRLELKQGEESMLLIRYERLPEYCFHCGILGPSYQFCQLRRESDGLVSGKNFAYGPWLKATGMRDVQQVTGSQVQQPIFGVARQDVQSDGMEDDVPGRGGQFSDVNGFKEQGCKEGFCQEDPNQKSDMQRNDGICPPLVLSDVLVKSDFIFQAGGRVDGNRGSTGSDGKGGAITKKKGKWKRWAREGGVRDVESGDDSVVGNKRLSAVDVVQEMGEFKKKKPNVAFDQESIEISVSINSVDKMDLVTGGLARCDVRLRQWNMDNKRALQVGVRSKKDELASVYGTGDCVDWKNYRKLNPLCLICCQREETSLHALWRCSALKGVRSCTEKLGPGHDLVSKKPAAVFQCCGAGGWNCGLGSYLLD
ncbi:hypothetical protein EZV62_004220 [Acer yangbiense]|uniref:Zinc knuckle CX2CX4HX4C domain-containing protein n=1 Tax=Acer yangbiense TaxID=1000413 RepID=A0A5C7IJI6_9ROSI|nr:hypothetical protein EZV62_004220 [Acer yangbiense]